VKPQRRMSIAAVACLAIIGISLPLAVGASGAPTPLASTTSVLNGMTPAEASQALKSIPASQEGPFSKWRADLEAAFPNDYGGFYGNPDGSFVVAETQTDPSLEAEALVLFQTDVSLGYTANATAAQRTVTFVIVKHSLQTLMGIYTAIGNDMTTLAPKDSVLFSGLDEKDNAVVVGTRSPDAATVDADLASRYASLGADPGIFRVMADQTVATPSCPNRTCDNPPWNGGDEMWSSVYGPGCTSGPPIHDKGGLQYVMQAGHCSGGVENTDEWYNPSVGSNNGAKEIAYLVSGSNFEPLYNQLGPYPVDQMLNVPVGGGSGITWGGPGIGVGSQNFNEQPGINDYRTPIQGSSDPYDGEPANDEGMITGTTSGIVWALDVRYCDYEGDDCTSIAFATTAIVHAGDSGAPIWGLTGFGNLIEGFLTKGSYSQGILYGVGQNIYESLYLDDLAYPQSSPFAVDAEG
jgi:hypothetical protein